MDGGDGKVARAARGSQGSPRRGAQLALCSIRSASAHPVGRTMTSELRVKLFIAGDSPRAREAAANLARPPHDTPDRQHTIDTGRMHTGELLREAVGILSGDPIWKADGVEGDR
jgi:hypothetical protein